MREAVIVEFVLLGYSSRAAELLAAAGVTPGGLAVHGVTADMVNYHIDDLFTVDGRRRPEVMRSLRAGATMDEVVAARVEGADLVAYATKRAAGLPHLVAADNKIADDDRTIRAYQEALRAGATHTEIIEFFADIGSYTQARLAGATHGEILDARRAGCILMWYARARLRGVSHGEAVTRSRR